MKSTGLILGRCPSTSWYHEYIDLAVSDEVVINGHEKRVVSAQLSLLRIWEDLLLKKYLERMLHLLCTVSP